MKRKAKLGLGFSCYHKSFAPSVWRKAVTEMMVSELVVRPGCQKKTLLVAWSVQLMLMVTHFY